MRETRTRAARKEESPRAAEKKKEGIYLYIPVGSEAERASYDRLEWSSAARASSPLWNFTVSRVRALSLARNAYKSTRLLQPAERARAGIHKSRGFLTAARRNPLSHLDPRARSEETVRGTALRLYMCVCV